MNGNAPGWNEMDTTRSEVTYIVTVPAGMIKGAGFLKLVRCISVPLTRVTTDGTLEFASLARRPRYPRPMSKPDPYGDWVLFPASEGERKNPSPTDNELIVAAREVRPRVLAHVKQELNTHDLGSDSASMAAQVWEQMLRSVSKTRRRLTAPRQPIADLQSYLFLAFVHRFNRRVQQERKHAERIELVSSSVDLERIESAQDTGWVEELERAITIREISDRMDGWTRKVWRARQLGYTWKEIASWLGVSEQQAKMKFQYGLERTRHSIVRLLKSGKPKGAR